MLDDRVRTVLRRLEAEDLAEREQGLPSERRSRAVGHATGALLYALAAAQPGCEVLEVGGSRAYSTIWLGAGARVLGGHVTSLEVDPAKLEAAVANVAEAGLDEWVDVVPGDAYETLPSLGGPFDLVFIDAEKEDYEAFFGLVLPKLEAGALVVADNVLSHVDSLGAYSAARQADPALVSLTVPLDRGLEVTSVLTSQLQ